MGGWLYIDYNTMGRCQKHQEGGVPRFYGGYRVYLGKSQTNLLLLGKPSKKKNYVDRETVPKVGRGGTAIPL